LQAGKHQPLKLVVLAQAPVVEKTYCRSFWPSASFVSPNSNAAADTRKSKNRHHLPNGSRISLPISCEPAFLREAINMLAPLQSR